MVMPSPLTETASGMGVTVGVGEGVGVGVAGTKFRLPGTAQAVRARTRQMPRQAKIAQ